MPIFPFILFILFMLGAMFFSASETAFTAIPQHKIRALIKQKKKWAKTLYQLKQEPEKMLTSILIGSNISNIGAASVGTIIAVKTALLLNQPQSTIVSISTVLLTILMLIFGEIFPKTFATYNAEKVSLWIAPFYNIFSKILSPLVWILEFLTKKFKKNSKKTMTDEDLEAFINLSKNYGILEADEDIKIKKILRLDELSAQDIMTPRTKIKAINDTLTISQAIQKISKTPYSRFPIYHKTIDDANRITTLKELIRFQEKYWINTQLQKIPFSTCIVISEKQNLNKILAIFKQTHKHLGLVIDSKEKKQQKVLGIVSLEDILEEVFWEIQDEADQEINPIIHHKKGIICQSSVRLDEALTALDIDFDDLEDKNINPNMESTTLNYFIINYLKRFPKKNEEISILLTTFPEITSQKKTTKKTYLTFKVLNIKENTIGEVEVKKGW